MVNATWYENGKGDNVKVLVCKDYETHSKKAAGILAGVINGKKAPELGLATGSSPVGTYQELIKLYQQGLVDFSGVRTYNLDEYYPLEPENDQSYHYFMNVNLFDHVNIDKNNVHVPDGNSPDMQEASESYEAMLNEVGGVDIQVLGIGGNGHIGFNEPCDTFVGPTHVVELTKSTIEAKILLVANDQGKAEAIKKTLEGPITPWVPASILQLHPDVTIIVDEAAASLLTEYRPVN